ncbi:hypothetical protein RSOL_175630 [Rhizoctonia solani AG-3 Rhs1AP]|uniref:Uncharacterized protein n=1 Tax=Rhizoctonia solani AG-3 Rhs1AP TaxID=1086054 RepID=X8J579_9AGAM|nr:hypothetical protein RSOL_175630 [Rhizoctonia solani AG-3 Rhs1AP]
MARDSQLAHLPLDPVLLKSLARYGRVDERRPLNDTIDRLRPLSITTELAVFEKTLRARSDSTTLPQTTVHPSVSSTPIESQSPDNHNRLDEGSPRTFELGDDDNDFRLESSRAELEKAANRFKIGPPRINELAFQKPHPTAHSVPYIPTPVPSFPTRLIPSLLVPLALRFTGVLEHGVVSCILAVWLRGNGFAIGSGAPQESREVRVRRREEAIEQQRALDLARALEHATSSNNIRARAIAQPQPRIATTTIPPGPSRGDRAAGGGATGASRSFSSALTHTGEPESEPDADEDTSCPRPPLTATATTFKGRMPSSSPRSQTPRAISPLGIAPTSPKKPLVSKAPNVPPLTDSPEESPLILHAEPESHAPAPSNSVAPFSPVHSLAAALRSASPGISSNASIVRSSSPAIRSASPAPAPSTASLPTPVTPTLNRSPAPSVLSFTSGRHVDRRSSSPYPPPTSDLPALPTHMNGSTASVYTPSIAPKELSNNASTNRKYTGVTIGLPSPATSASGTAAVHTASPSPTSTRFRQASTSSDAPIPTSTPPTVSVPFPRPPQRNGQSTSHCLAAVQGF